jgi:hypothetical protein
MEGTPSIGSNIIWPLPFGFGRPNGLTTEPK